MLPTLHSLEVFLWSVHNSNIQNGAIDKLNAYGTGIDQQDDFTKSVVRWANTRSPMLKTSQLL